MSGGKIRNKQLSVRGTTMRYAVFGRGTKVLVIIIGLLDGIRTIKGAARILAAFFRDFGKEYHVYVFGRKDVLETGYTIRDMARDQKLAMDVLGLVSPHVMGFSQGGMIAQCLAVDFPESINRMVIGVSASRPNPVLVAVLNRWMQMARTGDCKGIIENAFLLSYTEEKIRKYRVFLPLVKLVLKPRSYERFLIQAEACLRHDMYDKLENITCPVLVIGGGSDRITGPEASAEIASRIPRSKLVLYPGISHGAYEETKDFRRQVQNFLASPEHWNQENTAQKTDTMEAL